MKKKYEVRRRESDDGQHHLTAEPVRDPQSLLVPVTAIIATDNVRSDLPEIEALAASLRDHGMLQPIVAVRTGSAFKVVAGHRRLEAAKLAGLDQVPIRILAADGDQVAVVRLVENIQREHLRGVDLVRGVAALLPAFGGNQTAVADAIGKSKSYVSRCCRAAAILAVASVATSQHEITAGQLFELADAKYPEKLLMAMASGAAPTVRETRDAKAGECKPAGDPKPTHKCVTYRVAKATGKVSLRVAFDPRAASDDDRSQVIQALEDLLARLKKPT
jgi:ParB family chromosome partitioning protein